MSARLATFQAQLGLPAPLPVVFSPEVQAELNRYPEGTAPHVRASRLVALESTIISHGMPYPQNVECGRAVEAVIRSAGAVPATIAMLGGTIHVGLSDAELELLGKLGRKCAKCSRRDFPLLLARKANGATTVSGTILVASMLGLSVMATGGTGGVHRGGEVSMDVSADLTELGNTRMLVVCAGVKSILDIPRTLEYLETQGVAVMSYQTDEFPAFFTRHSGAPSPLRMESTAEGSAFVNSLHLLKYRGGGVLGVPLPETEEANAQEVEKAIQQSLKETVEKKVAGRDVTPYVLMRVNELTAGRSLKANIALVQRPHRGRDRSGLLEDRRPAIGVAQQYVASCRLGV